MMMSRVIIEKPKKILYPERRLHSKKRTSCNTQVVVEKYVVEKYVVEKYVVRRCQEFLSWRSSNFQTTRPTLML